GGGGGEQSPLPARRGRLPLQLARKPFMMIPRSEQPKLPLALTVLDAPEFNIDAADIGDPLGKSRGDSGGPGKLPGFPGGDGPGKNGGPGGRGGRDPVRERVTRRAQVIYQPEPEYSEEARKARFQGVVILSIEIS